MNGHVHERVRELITATDHLSRLTYAESAEGIAERFAALRTSLLHLDRSLGAPGPHTNLVGQVDVIYQRLMDTSAQAAPDLQAEIAPALVVATKLRAALRPRLVIVREPAPMMRFLVPAACAAAAAIGALLVWRFARA